MRTTFTTVTERLLSAAVSAALLIALAGAGCSKSTDPIDDDWIVERHPFKGISSTDETGNLLSEDPQDWCYRSDTPSLNPIPISYTLLPAYPNPFNGTCTIQFSVPVAGEVTVTISRWQDAGGIETIKEVRTLIDGPLQAGVHAIQWDGRDDAGNPLDDDFYRVKIIAGEFSCFGDIQISRPN